MLAASVWGFLHETLSSGTAQRILLIVLTWAVVVALTWLTSVFFNRVDRLLTRYGEPERRLAKLDAMADFFIVLIGVFVTLFILGVGQALWGAVAVTSVAGVIIGLAAQQLGQNLLAGIMILFERPFNVGDFVEIDGRTGSVLKVTLHSTTLLNPDGLVVLVPNSRVLNQPLMNFTRNPERRILLNIDVREDVRIDEVRSVLLAAIKTEEHLRSEHLTRVFVKEVLDEGTRFEVQFWVQATEFPVHCLPSATARLLKALNAAGFPTAMPTHREYQKPDPNSVVAPAPAR